MEASPNWKDGRFVNTLTQSDIKLGAILLDWFNRPDQTEPSGELPVVARRAQDFDAPPASGLRITWLGHSTALI